MTELVDVSGLSLDTERLGQGQPLVFLHGEDGTLFAREFLEALAERFEVIVPSHPGWGGSERASHVTSIDDIAYVYLDFLDRLSEGPVPVIGASIGAWVALEIATKSQADISALGLVAPIGIKVRGREERDFLDLYAEPRAAVDDALYADSSAAADLASLDEEGLLHLARAQEAVVRFAWQPYMHNPKLIHRLPRVTVPTAVISGARDRFVLDPGYYSAFTAAIPGAEEIVVEEAGHRIEEEQPRALADALGAFVEAAPRARV